MTDDTTTKKTTKKTKADEALNEALEALNESLEASKQKAAPQPSVEGEEDALEVLGAPVEGICDCSCDCTGCKPDSPCCKKAKKGCACVATVALAEAATAAVPAPGEGSWHVKYNAVRERASAAVRKYTPHHRQR